jgi:hypothetical protein
VRSILGLRDSATFYTAFLSLFLDAFWSIGRRLRKSTRVTMSNSGGEVKGGGEGISFEEIRLLGSKAGYSERWLSDLASSLPSSLWTLNIVWPLTNDYFPLRSRGICQQRYSCSDYLGSLSCPGP